MWSATTTDAEVHRRCCWPHHCAAATTSVPDAPSGICLICDGFSAGRFLFQSWASHQLLTCVGGCSGVCFLLSAAMLDANSPMGGSTIGVCTTADLQSIPMAVICASSWWSLGPHQEGTEWAAPCTALNRGQPYATQSAVHQPFQQYVGVYSFGDSAESSNPSTIPTWTWGGSSLLGLAPPKDTVNSEYMVGIPPGDSVVVIGGQVDWFTCTCSAEWLLPIHTFTLALQLWCHPIAIFHLNQGERIIHF